MSRTRRTTRRGVSVRDGDWRCKGNGWEYWGRGALLFGRPTWLMRQLGKAYRKLLNRRRRIEDVAATKDDTR